MKNINSYLLIPCLIFAATFSVSPSSEARKARAPKVVETFRVEILRCHDGDTCTGLRLPKAPEPERIKIRFAGIDAPEEKQKFGIEARDFLEGRIKGREVAIECEGKSFDRRTCKVFDKDVSINALMVESGWAWDSPKYSKGAYAEAQKEAALAKKGIWIETPEKSPFCFRHKKEQKCRISQVFNP